jgi:hypothetical protein
VESLARAGALALPCAFACQMVALLAIGMKSWRRTGPLRHGRASPPQGRPRSHHTTSRATALAGLSGGTIVLWGACSAAMGHASACLLIAYGLFATVSGCRSRVTELRVDATGLVIGCAHRHAFSADWGDCSALVPPRSPLGGWRIEARSGARTLMPSDLLGHECVLAVIVGWGEFRFDGSRWVRER